MNARSVAELVLDVLVAGTDSVAIRLPPSEVRSGLTGAGALLRAARTLLGGYSVEEAERLILWMASNKLEQLDVSADDATIAALLAQRRG